MADPAFAEADAAGQAAVDAAEANEFVSEEMVISTERYATLAGKRISSINNVGGAQEALADAETALKDPTISPKRKLEIQQSVAELRTQLDQNLLEADRIRGNMASAQQQVLSALAKQLNIPVAELGTDLGNIKNPTAQLYMKNFGGNFMDMVARIQESEGEGGLTLAASRRTLEIILAEKPTLSQRYGTNAAKVLGAGVVITSALGSFVPGFFGSNGTQVLFDTPTKLQDISDFAVGCVRVSITTGDTKFFKASDCQVPNQFGECTDVDETTVFCSGDFPTTPCPAMAKQCNSISCSDATQSPGETYFYNPVCSDPNQLFASMALFYHYKDLYLPQTTSSLTITMGVLAGVGAVLLIAYYIYRLVKQANYLRKRETALNARLGPSSSSSRSIKAEKA